MRDHRSFLYSTSKNGRLSAGRSAAADIQDVQNHVCVYESQFTYDFESCNIKDCSVAGHVKVGTAAKDVWIGGVEYKDGDRRTET